MPCFKGLAVSIHTPNGPLPEYSVQRQTRASRIACYTPVPPPKLPDSSTGKPEQSTFAISITLLTPGLNVPYSTPKPTPETPHPKPKVVGGLSNCGPNSISPYQPMTLSPNETIAAYIYFDGRQKEEVATLLRKGEETWVNSRWVGVPESEGGGLAEREFLFREVGLERWLNGLDLEGKDVAERIERRRQKMEKRRRNRELLRQTENAAQTNQEGDMDLDDKKTSNSNGRRKGQNILRYGTNEQSPVENLSDGAEILSSDSDDDDPIPETTGQIKVALFRVLASGEIKRGEYSPQFDAHDDDDDAQGSKGKGNGADIDHTTSFAKPKTLDPKSISTQTVTGIDATDKPYAIFTFMYRGERQLQKMGILTTPKSQDKDSQKASRRKSTQPDFASLGPLKPGGTTGFVGFRDGDKELKIRRGSKTFNGNDFDSDEEEDEDFSIINKAEDEEEKESTSLLSPDDAKQQGELAEGVRQIKLKRQHSADPLAAAGGNADASRTSKSSTPGSRSTPPATTHQDSPPPASGISKETSANLLDTDAFVGSPLKKQRASVSAADADIHRQKMAAGLSTGIHEIMGTTSGSTVSSNNGEEGEKNGTRGTSMLSETIIPDDIKPSGLDDEL
ncbi:hypothetical protein FQN57_007307 [Myotisia sp. PD_48]|nr:hypothetical protein FQN57_007307 [Myotisia sp. PD_48]